MYAEIADRKEEIADICRRHKVLRLEVFGSAARGTDFDPATSDVDFLVEFEPGADRRAWNSLHFNLRIALRELLDREVDLAEAGATDNPYLQRAIDRWRRPVYPDGPAETAAPAPAAGCSRDPRVYLWEADQAGGKIEQFTRGIDFEAFSISCGIQDAVCRCLGVTGRMLGRLHETFPEMAERIPHLQTTVELGVWVIKQYHEVTPEPVWKYARVENPVLLRAVRELLHESGEEAEGRGPALDRSFLC